MTRKVDTYEYEYTSRTVLTKTKYQFKKLVEIFTDKEFYKYYKKNI